MFFLLRLKFKIYLNPSLPFNLSRKVKLIEVKPYYLIFK